MYLAYQWNEVEMLLVNSAFASANFLGTLRYFSLPVSTPVDPNNQTEVEVRVKVLDANNTDSRLYVKDKPLIIKDASGKDYHMGQISSSVSWALRDVPENFSDDLDNLFPKGWVLHFVTL